MNQAKVVLWLDKWAAIINQEMNFISDLDNAIGDGDHGFNMSKGVTAYLEARKAKEPTSLADEFKLIGMTLLSKVGGASGPLYGSAFLAMGKLAADKSEVTHDELVTMLEAGVQSIMARGKSTVNEKTMVDVWVPAIEQLKSNSLTAEGVVALVEATKPMKATKGRAAYLGDRSIGHIDPGSYSSGKLFITLLEVL